MKTNINELGRFRDALRKTRSFRKDQYADAIPPHGVPVDAATCIVEYYCAQRSNRNSGTSTRFRGMIDGLCRSSERGMSDDLTVLALASRGWDRTRLRMLLSEMRTELGALGRVHHSACRARAVGKLSYAQLKGYLAYHRDNSCTYPVKKCASLGLLPYYARCVAELSNDRSEYNWEGARRAMQSVAAIRNPARAEILERAYICLHDGHGRHYNTMFCRAYRGLTGYPSALLATGQAKPVDLLPGTTASEAHALLSEVEMIGWGNQSSDASVRSLQTAAKNAYLASVGFFTRSGQAECRKARGAVFTVKTWKCLEIGQCGEEDSHISPRSILTAKWFVNVCSDPDKLDTLTRPRSERGPRGETAHFRFLDRADEIDDQDLDEGEHTPVVRAFENAARRMIEDHVSRYGEAPLCGVPLWWHDVPGVRLLRTARELAIEGRELDHCVAGYAPYVQRGDCYILALQTDQGRSTAEIFTASGALEIRQHYSTRNTPPPFANKSLLESFLTRGMQELLRQLGPNASFGHRHIDHDEVFGREYVL